MELVAYDKAVAAVQACVKVDEVKGWEDYADMARAYARMAKDKSLEISACALKLRSQRRLGQLLAAQKKSGNMATGRRGSIAGGRVQRPPVEKVEITLKDVGITKDLSANAQRLAAVPEVEFESALKEWEARVSQEKARVTAKLKLAGEREQKKQAEAKQTSKPRGYVIKAPPSVAPPEDAKDVTPADAMPNADDLLQQQRDYEQAQEELQSYRAADKNAELVKVIKQRDNFKRQCGELLDQLNAMTRRLQVYSNQLRRCAKLLGVDAPTKVAPAIEVLLSERVAA